MTCIALLTDFGSDDWFVGTMKGVIASIAPKARVIDICHDIPPGDIRAGAFSLLACFRYFPRGTVFVAVVDPGVGGPRAGLLAEAHGWHFIGPDNGILSYALGGGPPGTRGRGSPSPTATSREHSPPEARIRGLENPDLRLPGSGSTFHGRDIFAPAAAHLLAGKPPAAFGKLRDDFKELAFPVPYRLRGAVTGEIVHVDRFGNAITNLTPRDLPEKAAAPAKPKAMAIRAKGKVFPLAGFYAEAAAGKPLAVAGSCGFLELSVNGGNAARSFGLKRGDRVVAV